MWKQSMPNSIKKPHPLSHQPSKLDSSKLVLVWKWILPHSSMAGSHVTDGKPVSNKIEAHISQPIGEQELRSGGPGGDRCVKSCLLLAMPTKLVYVFPSFHQPGNKVQPKWKHKGTRVTACFFRGLEQEMVTPADWIGVTFRLDSDQNGFSVLGIL